MLPVNYRSWRRSFSKLPKSCQQWESTFLSTVAFRATKIPTTLRVDVPVAIRATKNLEDNMLPSDVGVDNVAFRATRILSTVGVGIPVDRSFQSYQNPDSFKGWRSLFHHLWDRHTVNYIIPPHMWVHHTEKCGSGIFRIFFFRWVRHLPSSITVAFSVAFRATKIPKTLRADVAVAIRATKTWKALCFPSTIGVDNVAFRSFQKPNKF